MWLWDLLISVTSTREDNIMTEWKEYTGSDGQIAEMRQSEHGFVARNTSSVSSIMSIKLNQLFISGQKNPYLPELFGNKVSEFLNYNNTTHYLICDPHPLEDMICQQARTGQPVYVLEPILVSNPTADTDFSIHETYSKKGKFFIRKDGYWLSYDTDKPNWYIPGAQYRLTPFEE